MVLSAINDMLPITLGDDSIGQIIESFGIRMVIVDPIQEYLEYDVYQDTPDMVYPIIYKLAQLAKESGCAVILMAYSDGLGGERGKKSVCAMKNVSLPRKGRSECFD